MTTRPTYDDANLILRLYEMRREERMRKARAWFTANFKVKTWDDLQKVAPPAARRERVVPHGGDLLGHGGVLHHRRHAAQGAVLSERPRDAARVGTDERRAAEIRQSTRTRTCGRTSKPSATNTRAYFRGAAAKATRRS